MAKLDTYEWRGVTQQQVDFKDDVTDILNNGKVAFPIVSLVPAWNANNGEMAFFDNAAASPPKGIYVRLSSSWALFATPGTAVAGGPEGAVQFNSSNALSGEGDLIWRSASNALLVNNGSMGASGAGIIALGIGNAGAAAAETVQLQGFNFGTDFAGLLIVPEANGPHFIGGGGIALPIRTGQSDQPSGNTLRSRSALNAPFLEATYGPSSIAYGTNNDSSILTLQFIDTTATSSERYISLQGQNDKIGSILIDLFLKSSITSELHGFLIGSTTIGGAIGPPQYSFNSSATLNTQRFTRFVAPFLEGDGLTASVSNAATVFIDGPPRVGSNITANNLYALWIGTGDIKVGGNIITGGNTTIVKNGGAFFSTTAVGVASNNSSEITIIRGIVGTTSLVANTFSEGRTIRLTARGYFNTTTTAGTGIMTVYLGGTALLSTSNQTITSSISSGGWVMESLITCQTTGGSGTLFCQGRFDPQSSATATQNWQMVGSSTVTMNTTGANIVEVRYQWGTANAGLQLFMTNCVGELLN